LKDRTIKHLILWIPTITIGLWEYMRHSFLLPYVSMEVGNWLAPAIVFIVSATLLTRLFKLLDDTNKKLQHEQQTKVALEERRKLAQELHDGISQSLFMLSVKIDRLETASTEQQPEQLDKLRQTVRHVYDDVRLSIANLQTVPEEMNVCWSDQLVTMIEDIRKDTDWTLDVKWELPEDQLSLKEKIALLSAVREALLNVRKHAEAKRVWIIAQPVAEGFVCDIRDDGIGFAGEPFAQKGKYGLKMVRDRTTNMGWSLSLERDGGVTVVRIAS
jgi:signal transduction histidine kinase